LFVTGGLKRELPVIGSVEADRLAQGQIVEAVAEAQDAHKLVGCGRTWMDQQIIIVDPDSLTLCPPDTLGEIWISGPNVAHGYWNQPEETEATFGAHLADTPANGEQRGQGPFLRTGDLGFLQDGELFISGRWKDLIIIDGLNHYPQDIELTVEGSHPTVRPGCSAAFSIDAQGREQLVIVAEVGRGEPQAIDTEEVTWAIRSAVSEWHDLQTHAIVLLKSHTIFKTSSGKIQRRACRDGFVSGSLDVWES
jgi:acyl-CoA synthetase (AMP-forming)/AMP-acid ligase II